MSDPEESNPLLPIQGNKLDSASDKQGEQTPPTQGGTRGWTANGLPYGDGSVVGEPVRRGQWDSSLFACLGRNDELCSSDLEVCLLGSLAPCVLYGSNVERLGSGPGSFLNHCLPYTGLYLLGNFVYGCNWMAPWLSFPTRTAIRQKYNLEGSCEALTRSCGCCGGMLEEDERREQCEAACDFLTHTFCHTCSLCQEGRELRRRAPHPAFRGQPVLIMVPPTEQMMDSGRS